MKIEWKKFLEDAGAVIVDDCVGHFGNPVRENKVTLTGAVIADMSHLGLIEVHGVDAQSFLQNLTCNDIKYVTETQSQLNAFCNNKGRVIALFRVFLRGDTFYLQLPRNNLEVTLKKLRMFVLRSKVTLEDATDALVRISFSGPQTEIHEDLIGLLPTEVNQCITDLNSSVIRLPGPVPRYEFIGELDSIISTWSKLDVHAAPVGKNSTTLLDIHAGIPSIYNETSEAFIPQMLNLHAINALSFKKGCFPGQEIVARMHYLGKLKRRMFLCHYDSDIVATPGDQIFTHNDQPVGAFVDACTSPSGGVDALAVIAIENAKTALHANEVNGPTLSIKELPYSIDLPT